MSLKPTFALSLCVVASACVRPYTHSGIAPQDGPTASVYAEYTGGLTQRNLRAKFKVDKAAYVLVGHLSGDGVIRVLYPESPRQIAKVAANTWVRTQSVEAYYDAVPALYGMTPASFRSGAARLDSYDGRGNGFVFVIASPRELVLDEVTDGALWAETEVPGYYRLHDPRLAVREFADMVADGALYTLEFAESFRTLAFTNYADNAWDCAALRGASFMALNALSWTNYNFGYGFSNAYTPSCGSAYSLYDSYWARQRFYAANATTTPWIPSQPVEPTRRVVRDRPRVEPGRTRMEPRVASAPTTSDRSYSPRSRDTRERARPRVSDDPAPTRATSSESSRPERSEATRPTPARSEPVRAEPVRSAPAPVERAAPRPDPKPPNS